MAKYTIYYRVSTQIEADSLEDAIEKSEMEHLIINDMSDIEIDDVM